MTKSAKRAYDKKHRARPHVKLYRKQYNASPRGKKFHEARRIFRQYGLTPNDHALLIKAQKGRCAICKDKVKLLHIDHDHARKVARGLLCRFCNVGLMGFRDSTLNLKLAARYLEKPPMPYAIKESTVEKYLKKGVRSIGGECLKCATPGHIGAPDRLVFFPNGKLVWVELKSLTGQLRPGQIREHNRLRKMGQTVVVLRSKEEVDGWLSVA